jgi:hypothetical protein
MMQRLLFAAALSVASLATHATPAQTHPMSIPVAIGVVGTGEIQLIVADGATIPCDSSDNRVIFKNRAAAGDNIKLLSATGYVCVDHTYGSFRQSQWAGPSIWSGGGARFGGGSSHLEGTVSTDYP